MRIASSPKKSVFVFNIVILAVVAMLAQAPAARGDVLAPATDVAKPTLKPDWSYAEKKMRRAGLKPKFIREMKAHYESGDFKNVIELNVLLFLKKGDDHGIQVTGEAEKSVKAYLLKRNRAFARAEKRYGVKPELVASLLYIESRYGKNLGRFQVASVFVDMLQVDRPEVVTYLQTEGPARFVKHVSNEEVTKIGARTITKSSWALEELTALQSIYLKRGAFAFRLRGSFAGAFGMSQFLPSSYARWARAFDSAKTPNLNRDEDAIASTAYYLKANGWKKNDEAAEMASLLQYNNSDDYARAIIRLAELVAHD